MSSRRSSTGTPDGADARGDELALKQIVIYLWGGRKIVGLCVAILTVLALLYIHIVKPTYSVTMLLAPASSNGSASTAASALSSVTQSLGLGGAASASATEFLKLQALFPTQSLAQTVLAHHPDILQRVFASQWNPKTKSWIPPHGIGLVIVGIKYVIGMPGYIPPNAATLAGYVSNNVEIVPNAATGLVGITLASTNRDTAKYLLTVLHDEADAMLRQAARKRTAARIAYLQRILPTVTVATQRDSLIEIQSTQEQNNMMIEADPNYAADVIDPPNSSLYPVWPNAILLLIGAVAFGMIIGIFLFLLFEALEVEPTELPLWRRLSSAMRSMRVRAATRLRGSK